MATFAERLQQLREDAGLTQAGLAEKSGLPLGSIRNYEQGQREPYWNALFKLAAGLGVPVDAFADCVSKDEAKGRAKKPKAKPKPGRAPKK
jgi:transcriptional regulator with XRE-family HTH domain